MEASTPSPMNKIVYGDDDDDDDDKCHYLDDYPDTQPASVPQAAPVQAAPVRALLDYEPPPDVKWTTAQRQAFTEAVERVEQNTCGLSTDHCRYVARWWVEKEIKEGKL